MNIIVGLGNPGSRYELTRHNTGVMILDNLRQVLECSKFTSNKRILCDVCKAKENIFIRPQAFMNESGASVESALKFYKYMSVGEKAGGYHNLYVIHDDLDLELGTYKIQYGIGPKTHNGLMSIYQHLGTKNFWHVRIGIDSRQGDRNIPPQTYVLEKFSPQQLEKINTLKLDIVKELALRLQN